MTDERLTSREAQQSALDKAHSAAAIGNAAGMVEALHQSYALDGLTRSMKWKWSSIPEDEVEFVIAEAVDELYFTISNGRKVLNLVAYLTKIADAKLFDHHEVRRSEIEFDVEKINEAEIRTNKHSEVEEAKREKIRAQAIALARSMLPRLGQDNIQNVMEMILDALERGDVDIPNPVIADALGLKVGTVRVLRSRGFERLRRVAEEAGFVLPKFDVTELEEGIAAGQGE